MDFQFRGRASPSSRIQHKVNQAGVDYYNNLLDELQQNGIEPIVTILRFDQPIVIQYLGANTSDAFIDYFVAYAELLFKLFGDRIKYWITFDDSYLHCLADYGNGYFRNTTINVHGIGKYVCAHNVLKAHVSAHWLYKKNYAWKQKGKVAMSFYSSYYYSQSGNREETERAMAFEVCYCSASDFFAISYLTSRIVYSVSEPLPVSPTSIWSADTYLNYTVSPDWRVETGAYYYEVPPGLGDVLK